MKSHTANELFELGFCRPPKMLIDVDDCELDPKVDTLDTLPTDDPDFVKRFTRFINKEYPNVHVAKSIENPESMVPIVKADDKLKKKLAKDALQLVLVPLSFSNNTWGLLAKRHDLSVILAFENTPKFVKKDDKKGITKLTAKCTKSPGMGKCNLRPTCVLTMLQGV